jgi:uncharacterized OsmC-like protein
MNAQTMIAAPTVTNGVNVTQLMGTIDAIKQQPELARFEFRATNRWIGGTQNLATVKSYFGACSEQVRAKPYQFLADEPPVLCGKDEGANPVEYLLSALSMCVTTTTVAHAASRGIRIEAVDSELTGDLDVRGFLGMSNEVRKGYQRITMRMRVKTDASPELLAQLAEYSPVHDVVSRSVPVELIVETY